MNPSNYKGDQLLFNKIPVIFKDPFLSVIDFEYVKKKLFKLIPFEYVDTLDSVYVGHFDFLVMRNLAAMYDDGVIYINSTQKSNESLILSIIHEIAHCVEEKFGYDIYGDKSIATEFLQKRMWLYKFLKSIDDKITLSVQDFVETEYTRRMDDYLFGDLDYNLLLTNTASVFVTPYSAVSLSEYFAIGFEYAMGIKGEALNVKKLCPQLFDKLQQLLNTTRPANDA